MQAINPKDESMSVTVSTLYVAILGLMFVPFTAYVGFYRVKTNILLLDGGDTELARRMRAQANFIETVPLAVILLILMEINGASAIWLHSLGSILVVARLVHYLTIATNPANAVPRGLSMLGTLSVYVVSATWLLVSIAG
jgi:uncharacterized membrane protein YecN with MAPEG domain